MDKKPYVIAYDFGTQSVRALIFDNKGNTVGKVKNPFSPAYYSKKPGWAEQDVDFYWQKLSETSLMLKNEVGEEVWSKIGAASVTTFRDAVVCWDKDLNVIRPVILYLDARRLDHAEEGIPLWQRALFKWVGMYDTVIMQREATFCNWIKKNEPEVWANTAKYTQFSAYVNYRFTGKLVDSTASMIGHFPFDYKRKTWLKKSDLTRHIFDCTDEQMAELCPPCSVIGGIPEEAAAATGLPVGLPFIASGSDKGCETLGTGCVGNDVASLSMGTAASVQLTTDKHVSPSAFMPAYPSLYPDKFNPETLVFRGYWMVTWFKNEFASKEVVEAQKLGISPEELLNKRLSEVPPGSQGLILQPYWSPGVKTPEAKGCIIGFSDVHSRIHLYRAIIEGIGYALYDGLKRMEKRAGYNVKRLTVSGGGANSDVICQITADIAGLKVQKVQTYETSALGCAMAAFVGMGEFKNLDEAVKAMSHVVKEYQPNPKNHQIYQQLFYRVYKKIYKANKKFYSEIKDVLCETESVRSDVTISGETDIDSADFLKG